MVTIDELRNLRSYTYTLHSWNEIIRSLVAYNHSLELLHPGTFAPQQKWHRTFATLVQIRLNFIKRVQSLRPADSASSLLNCIVASHTNTW